MTKREVVSDVLIVFGCAALTACAHLVYPPAAFGVGGVCAIALGWTVGRAKG